SGVRLRSFRRLPLSYPPIDGPRARDERAVPVKAAKLGRVVINPTVPPLVLKYVSGDVLRSDQQFRVLMRRFDWLEFLSFDGEGVGFLVRGEQTSGNFPSGYLGAGHDVCPPVWR